MQQQIIITLFVVFLDTELSGNSYVLLVVTGAGFEGLVHYSLFLIASSPIAFTFPDAFGSEEEGRCYLCEYEKDSAQEGAPLSLKSMMGDGVVLTVPHRFASSAQRNAFLSITEGQNIVIVKFNADVCYLTQYVYS